MIVDRALTALGIDAAQWRALARTYITLDFRPPGGATRQGQTGRGGGSPLFGLLFVSGISSAAFAFITATTPDALMSASLLTTYAAATTMMILLVDFTGVVVSPDDYGVLGHRPVGSRTYFAARLAAIAVYVGAMSLVMALLPAIVYSVKTAPLAGLAAMLAVLLCDLCTAVFVVTGYVALLGWVHPARLRRAMSYLQLVAAMTFYVLYYLATQAFRSAFLERGFAGAPWLWAMPSTWFAAFVAVAAGHATAAAWIAAAAAVLVCVFCVPLAAGRLSLDYARRIGEMTAVGEPAARRRAMTLPGFGRDEARAVALLGVLLADAAGDHRHGADAQAHRHRVDDGQHRLGDPDRRDGVPADPRHEEHVDHGEQRLHRHFEHHRHRQHDQRRTDRPDRVVAVGSANGFPEEGPPALHDASTNGP